MLKFPIARLASHPSFARFDDKPAPAARAGVLVGHSTTALIKRGHRSPSFGCIQPATDLLLVRSRSYNLQSRQRAITLHPHRSAQTFRHLVALKATIRHARPDKANIRPVDRVGH